MTDVLDRLQSTPLPEATPAMPRRRLPFAMSDPARVLLAALSAAAGVIHLVMVPSHMAESTVEGIGFAVAGWSQLVIAALVFIAPSRALLRATVVANLAFIGAWVVSRTAGLPFGENAGHAESVGFLDLTCVALEAALILASCAVLARPGLGSALRGPRLGLAAVVPIGILALTTAAIASPGARNHAHGSHGDTAMAADHHDGASAAGGHHDAAGASDDLGLGMLHNGHHTDMKYKKLSAADQAKVDELLDISRSVAAKYPTLGAAIDAGFRRAGPFAPGLGIHYLAPWVGQGLNPDGVMDENDMAHPMMVIFDGTEPSAKFAGFMYYSVAADEPAGLPGDERLLALPHERLHLCRGRRHRRAVGRRPVGRCRHVRGARRLVDGQDAVDGARLERPGLRGAAGQRRCLRRGEPEDQVRGRHLLHDGRLADGTAPDQRLQIRAELTPGSPSAERTAADQRVIESGRRDLNPRPQRPERCALTKLRHFPVRCRSYPTGSRPPPLARAGRRRGWSAAGGCRRGRCRPSSSA